MEHECKFEDKVIEMHGDIKSLVAEFKAMNGSLKDTKKRFDFHSTESDTYRQKTTTIWTTLIVIKYMVICLGGLGLLAQAVLWFYKWVVK